MMRLLTSSPALALASAAALAMTATPAMARHYHRDRGIDGGDVLAGILIIGGIAAIASAASKSNRNREARDYRYPNRYPESRYPSDSDYRDWRAQRDNDAGYANDRDVDRYGSSDWRGGDAIDGAISACAGEIERGNREVESVEGVNRESNGWRVDGTLRDGRTFSCTAGPDGRVRSATVDGRALS